MKLALNSNLIFHAVETRRSKAGNDYSVVLLRDVENFEEWQFFRRDDLDLNGLKQGEPVYCEYQLEKRGFNVQVNLTAVKSLA